MAVRALGGTMEEREGARKLRKLTLSKGGNPV